MINVSAMSFGSLSSAAVTAINLGCAKSGALHNTGEGGISSYHDKGGGLIWQLGTGYFGARADDGKDHAGSASKSAMLVRLVVPVPLTLMT